MIVDQALKEATAELAASAGIHGEPKLQRLHSHGHNRLFQVEIGDCTLVLKRYFHGRGDRRERVRTEFAFSRFAWSVGARDIPQPIAADYTRHAALFRFVDGRRMTLADLGPAAVAAAVQFVARINSDPRGLSARALPRAFDSVSSDDEHTAMIEARLASLVERAEGFGVDPSIGALINERLRPAWTRVIRALSDLPPRTVADHCISPSSFGFHHAMIAADGRLIFHDFEYAGWDDPARLVAEMFAQPQLPIPAELLASVAGGVRDALGLSSEFIERARRSVPLYRMYGCCALLDEILPGAARPRERKRDRPQSADRRALVEHAISELAAAAI